MRLHRPDVAHRQARGEKRVLAQVFGIPAVERRAHDVHAGPEHDVFPTLPGLLADHVAIGLRGRGIPRRRQGDPHRQARCEIVRPACRIERIRPDVLTHTVRPVRHPTPGQAEAVDGRRGKERVAMHEGDLLIEREPRQQVVDPRFKRLSRVQVKRALLRLRRNRQQRDGERRQAENQRVDESEARWSHDGRLPRLRCLPEGQIDRLSPIPHGAIRRRRKAESDWFLLRNQYHLNRPLCEHARK